MARRTLCLLFWSVSAVAGCSSSNFSGKSEIKKPQSQNENATQPPLPSANPSVPVPPSCKPGTTITNVKNLTSLVDQTEMHREIVFELSLYDCPGTTAVTVSNEILFDIDGISTSLPEGLNYRVEGDGKILNGYLRTVYGSDLFGNSGEFVHYRSDEKITVTTKSRTVRVTVDMSKEDVVSSRLGQISNMMSIPTYFKFGTAEPVRLDIRFTAPSESNNGGWG